MAKTRWLALCMTWVLMIVVFPFQGVAQEYLLGPGDVVDITVFGDSDLTKTVTVRSDGKISLPLLGEIFTVGLTPTQLAEKITTALKPYFKDPKVTVTLSQPRPLKIYLVGELKSPGSYDMKPGWTVVEAIAQAGGLTDKANLKKSVLIRRSTNTTIPLDLDRLILKGDQTANMAVEDGDVIQVPEFQNRVLVLGHVRSPGAYDLKGESRVLDAILAAGGPDEKAALDNVGVIRQVGGKATLSNVNVAKLTQVGDVSGNVPVQHADIVYVPQTGRISWRDIVQWILDFSIFRAFLGF